MIAIFFASIIFLAAIAIGVTSQSQTVPITQWRKVISSAGREYQIANPPAVKVEIVDTGANGGFLDGFALKVTNLSQKPIYYLEAKAAFREVPSQYPLVLMMSYGDPRFRDFSNLATDEDLGLAPGEIIELKPTEIQIRDYEKAFRGKLGRMPTQIRIGSFIVSHGDKSGYYFLSPVINGRQEIVQNLKQKSQLVRFFNLLQPKAAQAQGCSYYDPNPTGYCPVNQQGGGNCLVHSPQPAAQGTFGIRDYENKVCNDTWCLDGVINNCGGGGV